MQQLNLFVTRRELFEKLVDRRIQETWFLELCCGKLGLPPLSPLGRQCNALVSSDRKLRRAEIEFNIMKKDAL